MTVIEHELVRINEDGDLVCSCGWTGHSHRRHVTHEAEKPEVTVYRQCVILKFRDTVQIHDVRPYRVGLKGAETLLGEAGSVEEAKAEINYRLDKEEETDDHE